MMGLRLLLAFALAADAAAAVHPATTAPCTATTTTTAKPTVEAALVASTPEELEGESELEGLSNETTLVVGGIVEAFLHKQGLKKGELRCLVKGSGKLAGEVMTVSAHTVMLVQQMLGFRESPKQDGDDGGDADELFGDLPDVAPDDDVEVDEVSAEPGRRLVDGISIALSASALFLELGVSLQDLIHLSHQVVKQCVRGDALQALQLASDHLQNMEYVGGHLLANGADIIKDVGHAVQQWQKKDYQEFGRDIGRALRSVLLANETSATLPEGVPDEAAMENITQGLFDGLFGRGVAVDFELVEGTGTSTVRIDLHQCIGENTELFNAVWSAMALGMARQENTRDRHAALDRDVDSDDHDEDDDDNEEDNDSQDKVQLNSIMGLALAALPDALKKCQITEEQEEMLTESLRALGAGMSIHFEVAGGTSLNDVGETAASTLEDWADRAWYEFGKDLGQLLQDMLVSLYPQLYSVDGAGLLRKELKEIGHLASERSILPLALLMLPTTVLLLKVGTWVGRRRVGSMGALAVDMEAQHGLYSPTATAVE